jgi:hypothetical protein
MLRRNFFSDRLIGVAVRLAGSVARELFWPQYH